jgi:thiamine-phosphate pyrophosphorylase
MLIMVTDRHRVAPAGDAAALVRASGMAARAGVTMSQVRERSLDDRLLLDLSRAIVAGTAGTETEVVINDRADVALACGARGVHLPSRGADPARVRAIAPAGFVIGRSVHSEAEAVAAERAGGCDYLIFGTVFETASKPAGHAAAGIAALARVCAAVALPVVAIGGVVAERAREIAQAGAAGVAGIGLFATGDDTAVRDRVRRIEDAFATD